MIRIINNLVHPPTIESLVKFGAIPVTLLKILKSPGPSDSLKEEETTVSHTIHAKMNVLLLIKTLVTKGKMVNLRIAGCEDESRSSLVKVLTDLVNSDDATRDASTVEFQFQAAISDILKSVA